MLAILGTLLSGVLSGGATGLLGVLLQRFFDMKARQQDIEVVKLNHQNALALADKETERARIQASATVDTARIRAEADQVAAEEDRLAREAEADSRSLVASYEADRAAYLEKGAQLRKGKIGGAVTLLMALVDFLRGVLRPGLTVYLTAIVTVMFTQVLQLLQDKGHEFATTELAQLLTQIVATILYCFTTCVVWWFGSRPPKRQGDR
jgi:hypothetical protein